MNRERVIAAAKDCIKQFLASRYPLKNVAKDMIALRNLNSGERRALLDLVFRFSREFFLFEHYLHATVRFATSMPPQEKNVRALELFAFEAGLRGEGRDNASLAQGFQNYVANLGEQRYLTALSPFIRERLIKDYGDEAGTIAKGLSGRSAKYLAYDRSQIHGDALKAALTVMGVTHFAHPLLSTAIGTHDDLDMSALPRDLRDHVWLMDAGSQIIAELIAPAAHHRVLDLCAGEGNKARYITMHVCDYVAVDLDASRLQRAQERLQGKPVQFVVSDGRKLPQPPESFDWILLDAPCTGIGVLRRHPDLKFRVTQKCLNDSLELQRELLASAINLLKPGGILIYATCSLFTVENDQQIEVVLRKNSRIKPWVLKDLVGERMRLGDDALCNNSLTLFPHIDDCDGFFVAALKKVTA